ncbi:MAG TPA: hypothetical protein VFU40_11560 [Gemmatimonadales bacterium]|nr:hypothetical protein [Gemmatimonadales bacterium]
MRSAVPSLRIVGTVALFAGVGLAVSAESRGHDRTVRGKSEAMGAGTVQSFVTTDPSGAPVAVGVTLSAGALAQLPQAPNTVSRCFDLDGNGTHTQHECIGDEERILDVPGGPSNGLPFRWISVNWNPAGHIAPYNRPHFDFHFHTGDRARVEAIAPGRCGELADCEDFKRATRPVPAQYLPSGYIDVGAVVPRMGNHLLDSQSPELKDSLPFTSTFIYGAYEGELIFWEPMITLDFLQKTRDACIEIHQPEAFRQAGYYPTQYCVRQDGEGQRTVSLERFRYSQAL